MFSKKLVVCLAASLAGSVLSSEEEIVYPSSCRDLPDGDATLKLMDGDLEDSPLVEVTCSNGHIILDVSKDNDLTNYFDTFMNFHHSVGGPTNDIHVNWEGWYKPDDGSTQYLISPDCNACEEDHTRQLFKSSITTDNDAEETTYLQKTAYMMTGTMFGCFWNLKGEHNFDMDYDTYQCYYTTGVVNEIGESIREELGDENRPKDWDSSGVCAFSVRRSNKNLPSSLTHDTCTVDFESIGGKEYDVYHLKPSIGTNGEHCVCVKPSSTQYFTLSSTEATEYLDAKHTTQAETITAQELETETLEKASVDDIYELKQKDFEAGTYRILKSGTYKIMEDIVFDFNANYDTPNSEDAWWPHSDQSDIYPGAGDYHDPYFLGFYAGITVEADDVVIDLNGHELRMSDHFYWQQRWFTTISLLSQYFLPGQGIGFFGANPHFAENVIIKNGALGLTSHHGIHGHFNKNILIENVQIKEFETHGIQFNGFDGITIKNCEIGPTAEKSYFKGEYGHARTLLPRFQKIADEYPNEKLQFYGRDEAVTMQDIVDELQKQVDMAYYYVTQGKEYDDDDESWISAKNLFIDDTGYPNGAAMYGIFLNTYGASVLTYNLYTSFYSSDATVQNVKIHGLRHSMTEYIRMSLPESGNLFMNALHAPFDAAQVLDSITDFSAPRYKGSILTDAALAMEKLSDNWNYLQAQLIIDSDMLDWAFGDNLNGMDDVQIGCNIDVMIHSGKGINALRIDGVDGVTIENIQIYDIIEKTPMGRSECGEYTGFQGGTCTGACGGHFRQTAPMQIGFSGNMLQGININAAKNIIVKNANIYDLESEHGHTYGISVWPAVHVEFQGKIETKYLIAGSNIEKGTIKKRDRPNMAPEVCGVRVYNSYESGGFMYTATVKIAEVDKIATQCVDGHYKCLGSDSKKTSLGDYVEDSEESCDWSVYGKGEEMNEEENEESDGMKVLSSSELKSLFAGQNGKNGNDGLPKDGGDSTNTVNNYDDNMFKNTMLYLIVFLALSMIAIMGGKFVKQWFPVVGYIFEKRFPQRSNRLNQLNGGSSSSNYTQYTQIPSDDGYTNIDSNSYSVNNEVHSSNSGIQQYQTA